MGFYVIVFRFDVNYTCVHVAVTLRGFRSPGTRVTGARMSPDVGAGSRTWVPCKSSTLSLSAVSLTLYILFLKTQIFVLIIE